MSIAYILRYTFSEDGRGSPTIAGITLDIEVAKKWNEKSTYYDDYDYQEVKIYDSIEEIKH